MHSTNDLEDGYMGSGRRLRASISKHGDDNHTKEVLEFFGTRELLIEAEIEAITDDMITDKDCMNLMGGGTGGYISEQHYQLTSKLGGDKHAERMKNDKEYRNKTLSTLSDNSKKVHEEGKVKLPTFSGLTHSDESKEKMSNKAKERVGEKNSQFGTCWITKEGHGNKKIKKEVLDFYIEQNWEKGRK